MRMLLLLLTAVLAWGALPAEEPLTLRVHPPDGTAFQFGTLTPTRFTLENRSNRALLVTGLRAASARADAPIALAGVVSGELRKVDGAYLYDPRAPHAAPVALYVAFLLPGQRVQVLADYRPLMPQETFTVTYCAASTPYDGSVASLAPLAVYIPRLEQGQIRQYVPFDAGVWTAMHGQESAHVGGLQPAARAVQRARAADRPHARKSRPHAAGAVAGARRQHRRELHARPATPPDPHFAEPEQLQPAVPERGAAARAPARCSSSSSATPGRPPSPSTGCCATAFICRQPARRRRASPACRARC